jgi:sugar phosphate isomerase/epimerase
VSADVDQRVQAGLCSVTFRALPTDAIVDLAVETGLAGIEWGGDVHAPPGDLERAAAIARRCAEAGIATPSYGSYLVAGEADQPITAVLDTASALGATTVRVWAGRSSPDLADAAARHRVAGHLAALADRASAHGLTVALEFHPGTLTETVDSTLALLADAGDDRLRSYWQPRGGQPVDESLAEIDALAGRLAHLHVFWWDGRGTRLPLADGEGLWREAFVRASRREDGFDRYAFLEFVADDDPDAFRRDSAALRRFLGER